MSEFDEIETEETETIAKKKGFFEKTLLDIPILFWIFGIIALAGYITYEFWPAPQTQTDNTTMAVWHSAYQKPMAQQQQQSSQQNIYPISNTQAQPIQAKSSESLSNNGLTKINTSLNTINQQLTTLTTQQQALSKEINTLKLEQKENNAKLNELTKNLKHTRPKKAITKPKIDLTQYHINTIDDGIVWLQFNNQTYAMQVGQSLNGFKILKIDAQKREVLTTAGAIYA